MLRRIRNSARASLVGMLPEFRIRLSWILEGFEGSRLTPETRRGGYGTVKNPARQMPARTTHQLPHGALIFTPVAGVDAWIIWPLPM